ncbi:MAG: hypothetical protein ACRDRK_26955 [Pseudonocardia sp.]
MTAPAPIPPPRRRFGMPLRDLVILIVSAAGGATAGLLLITAAVPAGQAVLGGFAAFAGTLYFLDRIAE